MKNKRIRFVTLFPNCPNIGLVKDVGQIPYTLSKNFENIESRLVSYCIDPKGDNLDSVNGLILERCSRVLKSDFLSGAVYLLKNSKCIDWLNLYHCRKQTYLWAKLYKMLNPEGKVYLKLDMGHLACELLEQNETTRKNFAKNISIMDLVSTESAVTLETLKKYVNCDIKLIYNGFCKNGIKINVEEEREDNFVTVARLGSPEKATDLLLEAFSKSASFHDWNLKLIGSIEPEFESFIDIFFEKNPELQERVQFLGAISDRGKLYNELCKMKVFVLPSKWEGFPLVLPEALMCGCSTLISSNVPPREEMTCDGKYGDVFLSGDVENLKEKLIEATVKSYTPEKSKEISEYAERKFSWDKICTHLYKYLI